MARKKKETKKSPPTRTKVKGSKRLKKPEQVRDRKKDAVGFGSRISTFEPYSRLSISQLREFIMNTVWIDTCVETITDEVVKYPLYTDPSVTEIDSFLNYPSMKEPLSMIRKQYLKDMLKWGNGGCAIEYKKGKPNSLIVVPGYTIRVTDKEPQTYKLLKLGSNSNFIQDGDKDLEYDQKEFIHFCMSKESDSTLGESPLQHAYHELVSDQASSERLAKFIRGGFYKPSFLSFKKGQSISGSELEEFIEYMNSLLVEGVKLLGINKEVELSEIPFWDANDIIEVSRWIGLKIASVYKVPPFMLNLVQDVGSLNAREQKARFLENVVMPILQYESFLYTNVLARLGFKDVNTEITTHVLGTRLNYDRAKIANMLVGNDSGGILTVDEVRKMFFNLPPKEVIPVEEEDKGDE